MKETTLRPLRVEWKSAVYEDVVRKIQPVVAHFPGFRKDYLVSDYGERAAVVVVTADHVLFTRQYRLLVDDISYEIPGGHVDQGETPREAAARECTEETGVACHELEPLLCYQSGMDVVKNQTHVFCASLPGPVDNTPSERRIWLPLSACERMLNDGAIQDGLTLAALYGYLYRRARK